MREKQVLYLAPGEIFLCFLLRHGCKTFELYASSEGTLSGSFHIKLPDRWHQEVALQHAYMAANGSVLSITCVQSSSKFKGQSLIFSWILIAFHKLLLNGRLVN